MDVNEDLKFQKKIIKLQKVLESCEDQKDSLSKKSKVEEIVGESNHASFIEYLSNIPDFSLYFDEISEFFRQEFENNKDNAHILDLMKKSL